MKKNLNFLQEDKNFLELLNKQQQNAGELSILPLLDDVLKQHNINLKHNFFLESYITSHKNCEFLNEDFLELFNKAVYLNEKEGLLDDLLLNNYDKVNLCEIIFGELDKKYNAFSETEVELYKWGLCDMLYSMGLKQFEDKYIELLLDSSLGSSREMLVPLLKKIKCSKRKQLFEILKSNDDYFMDYKYW